MLSRWDSERLRILYHKNFLTFGSAQILRQPPPSVLRLVSPRLSNYGKSLFFALHKYLRSIQKSSNFHPDNMSTNKNNSDNDNATAAAAALLKSPPDHGHCMLQRSMGPPPPAQAPDDPPPPPLGGGATNPKPPDEHSPCSSGISTDTQSDSSSSLLTPSSLEDTAGFTVTTATRGLRTTPPHKAVVCMETPLPPTTRNSFTALLPTASPTPSENSTDNPAPTNAPSNLPPTNPGASSNIQQEDEWYDNSSPAGIIQPDGFLTTFLKTWPEELVTDATSRRIWNSFHQSHSDADSVFSTLAYRQSDLYRKTMKLWSNTRTCLYN